LSAHFFGPAGGALVGGVVGIGQEAAEHGSSLFQFVFTMDPDGPATFLMPVT
jgi:hypothetical protein